MTTTPKCGAVHNGWTCSEPKGHDRPFGLVPATHHRGQHATGQAWMAWPPQPTAEVPATEEEQT